ncbi:MAG: hypothetical protein EZS28_009242 [Streblomastix strix]|uniref:Uncharacterized protein n=1 Tax=Streblomastix strix TaxID=222440 RepID=A0A5J4WL08_9EUKA|nr:MAG: hypothetical protein EZS28_009242 [Streblomastix strix]
MSNSQPSSSRRSSGLPPISPLYALTPTGKDEKDEIQLSSKRSSQQHSDNQIPKDMKNSNLIQELQEESKKLSELKEIYQKPKQSEVVDVNKEMKRDKEGNKERERKKNKERNQNSDRIRLNQLRQEIENKKDIDNEILRDAQTLKEKEDSSPEQQFDHERRRRQQQQQRKQENVSPYEYDEEEGDSDQIQEDEYIRQKQDGHIEQLKIEAQLADIALQRDQLLLILSASRDQALEQASIEQRSRRMIERQLGASKAQLEMERTATRISRALLEQYQQGEKQDNIHQTQKQHIHQQSQSLNIQKQEMYKAVQRDVNAFALGLAKSFMEIMKQTNTSISQLNKRIKKIQRQVNKAQTIFKHKQQGVINNKEDGGVT